MLKARQIDTFWNGKIESILPGWCSILIIISGNGSVVLDGKNFEIFSSRTFFIGEGVGFRMISGTVQVGFLLSFHRILFYDFLLHYPLARGFGIFSERIFVDVPAKSIVSLLKELKMVRPLATNQIDLVRLKLRFGLVILALFAGLIVPRTINEDKLLACFIKLLEENFHLERKSGFYASKLCVTMRKLNVLCREWFCGKNFEQMHRERLLSEAEYLLTETDKSIKEISFVLGFCSQQHFRGYFSRHKKTNPTAFRRINRS